ncbi:MAG: hypothetical protein RMK29_03725 [Myxococcales bacterium]|nr:hypothetical protein [Myxococcales bacterium]
MSSPAKQQKLPPPPEPGPADNRVTWFQSLFASASALLRLLLLTPAVRARLRVQWGDHVPRLSLALADMIQAAPELFAWVEGGAERLRESVRLIEELTHIQAAQHDFATRLNDTLLHHRAELFRHVRTVVQGLLMTLDSPATDPAVRARLHELSSSVRAILEERSAQVRAAREEGAAAAEARDRIGQLESDLAERDRQLRSLRGEPAPPPPPVAPRRTSRRTPRRTRR